MARSGSGAPTPARCGVGRVWRGGRAGLRFSGLPWRALQRGGGSALPASGSRPARASQPRVKPKVTLSQYFQVTGVPGSRRILGRQPAGPTRGVRSRCSRSPGARRPRFVPWPGVCESWAWVVDLSPAATEGSVRRSARLLLSPSGGVVSQLGGARLLICRGDLCELSIVWVRAALRAASEARFLSGLALVPTDSYTFKLTEGRLAGPGDGACDLTLGL